MFGLETEVRVSEREGRVPPPAARGGVIQGAVYSSVARELAQVTGEVWPLHVGDTWLRPPPGCAVEELGDVAQQGHGVVVAALPTVVVNGLPQVGTVALPRPP